MINYFDLSALILAVIGAFYFKINRNNSIFIVFTLACHNILTYTRLIYVEHNFYLMQVLFEFMFLVLAISMRVKPVILIILLISIMYNGLSYIEYPTEYDFIYRNYPRAMGFLIVWLVSLIFYDGLKNGLTNNHNTNDDNPAGGGGGLSFGKIL